ncbi:MAG: hypothetical protein ACREEO_16430, partial [Phenylobacterium sp.]
MEDRDDPFQRTSIARDAPRGLSLALPVTLPAETALRAQAPCDETNMSDPQPAAPQRADMPAHAARRLLELEAETRFTLKDGRIASEAPPDNAPGPLLYVAGGRIWVAETVAPSIARELRQLARAEPTLASAPLPAAAVDRYLALLPRPGAASGGLSYLLPHGTQAPGAARTIASGSAEAKDLEAHFEREGMPRDLLDLNFRQVADLWPPYCLVVEDGGVAALAFTARRGLRGAELGLVTLPGWR